MFVDEKKLLDFAMHVARIERSRYHLTLGKMIELLKGFDQDSVVLLPNGKTLGIPMSYRGYYSDLAFTEIEKQKTVAELLAQAEAALGQTFEGYKGGDFVMAEDTPVWISEYGNSSGIALMDLQADFAKPKTVFAVVKQID
jgi:hypothetical protein